MGRPRFWPMLLLFAVSALAGVPASHAADDLSGAPSIGAPRAAGSDSTSDLSSFQVSNQAGPIDAGSYILGPGDLLSIDLWGRLVKNWLLPVDPQGEILLQGYGHIEVAGKTLAWAQHEVARIAVQRFVGVNVRLRLARMRVFKVYLSGLFASTGAVNVSPAMRAEEVVDQNRLAPGASRRNIAVRHLDGTESRLDIDYFRLTGRSGANPFLLDGDVLFVPRMTSFINIYGAVANPGRYEWTATDSLSTLLRLGGGLLPAASRDLALLVRFPEPSRPESLWIPVDDLLSGRQNPLLEDGDHLFVYFVSDYHSLPMVEIRGDVQKPGTYPFVLDKDHLSDIVRRAGGFTPRANRSAVHIIRESAAGEGADPDFERLVRLSRAEMTESEYAMFQTKLAERKNSFRVNFDRYPQDPEGDPLLQHMDVIRVDPSFSSVRVDGQVRRPGLVDYEKNRTWSDYVRLSGGFTDRGAPGKVRVSRSLTGQVVPAKSIRTIQPGDFIWVPERKDVDSWQVFRDVVVVAGQIAVIVLAVRK